MELSLTTRMLLFLVLSLVFLRISWKPLHNPRSHGFYRFFAFEGIVVLLLLNAPFWFREPLSPRQLFSWTLLAASIAVVLMGLSTLRRKGGRAERAHNRENFAFENTASLVQSGIYRYIRHPMYASLLYLAWGAFCKQPSLPSLAAVLLTSLFLYLTARVEEGENTAFFGVSYQEYMRRSRMFVPFLF